MGTGKELTEQEVGQIIAFKTEKKSNRWIARHLGRNEKTIRNYLKDPERSKRKKRTGRPSKINTRTACRIFRLATVKHLTSKQIAAELDGLVHHSTVRRVLRTSKFAKYIKRKKSPALKTHHKKARLDFATKKLRQGRSWKRVVFSDEKKFNLDGPDGCQYYWHDLRKEKEVFSTRMSGGGSVMIWAGINFYGKTELAFLEGKQDSRCYTRTLDGFLLPFIEKIRREQHLNQVIFQQDGASIHTSHHTNDHLNAMGIKHMKWPAKSPDLNPIENVWGQLALLVYENGRQFESREDLKIAIRKSWDKIQLSYLQRLVESMTSRMVEVVLSRGASIDR